MARANHALLDRGHVAVATIENVSEIVAGCEVGRMGFSARTPLYQQTELQLHAEGVDLAQARSARSGRSPTDPLRRYRLAIAAHVDLCYCLGTLPGVQALDDVKLSPTTHAPQELRDWRLHLRQNACKASKDAGNAIVRSGGDCACAHHREGACTFLIGGERNSA